MGGHAADGLWVTSLGRSPPYGAASPIGDVSLYAPRDRCLSLAVRMLGHFTSILIAISAATTTTKGTRYTDNKAEVVPAPTVMCFVDSNTRSK
jgi:hypothetical protein